MTSITQDMKYRLSLIRYAEKYGVTKAAIKYKTNRQYIYRWKRRFDGSIAVSYTHLDVYKRQGQERHFLYPQAVNDDMHMDVAAVVMPVRVGADKGLMAGEMLFTELLPQRLRPVYGQAVVRPVPWVKADDIVVAFHILPPLIFLIAEIGAHTRNGKILAAAVQRGQAIILTGDKPAVFIKDGLHSKFVMLKEQVLFGGSVVGVLRA